MFLFTSSIYQFFVFVKSGIPGCTDFNHFKDKYGATCEQVVEIGNCKNGAPNKVASRDIEFKSMENMQNDANAQGISVLDACCQCGGGNKENETVKGQKIEK